VQTHAGKWRQRQSLVTIEPENVVLTALKKAEDSDGLIFRFYEWAGKNSEARISVPAGATAATLTNLMEQPESSSLHLTANGQVIAPIRAYEIETVRVDYPLHRESD
ncbi:MAG: glycosyl hydrolase-related protein, partial [Candidatus Acidiferrales bacterium]